MMLSKKQSISTSPNKAPKSYNPQGVHTDTMGAKGSPQRPLVGPGETQIPNNLRLPGRSTRFTKMKTIHHKQPSISPMIWTGAFLCMIICLSDASARLSIYSNDGKTWVCTACTLRNTINDPLCKMCGAPPDVEETWVCTACTYRNTRNDPLCKMCGFPPDVDQAPSAMAPLDQSEIARVRRNFPRINVEAVYVADQSQYGVGVTAGCTIMCLQAALELTSRSGADPTVEMVGQILRSASGYKDVAHTAAMATLEQESSKPFNDAMKVLHLSMIDRRHGITSVIRDAEELARYFRTGIAVVLTKPPESVMIFIAPNDQGVLEYLLFDSHSRRNLELTGAYMMTFRTREDLEAAFQVILPPVNLPNMSYLYNVMDCAFLCSLNAVPLTQRYQDNTAKNRQVMIRDDQTGEWRWVRRSSAGPIWNADF